ncbi:hypothetical protein QOZ80_1BG0058470 [Eleusine coracana subsp. coracana]|nr:hypothetical protein QOZ80_1BG0058470 [Eleusine coracana subsp. coracana]
MRLKHSNVVLLEGCCSETKEKLVMYKGKLVCAEETERLLCFEYMPKGNLRGYLSDESSGLDWGLRYKIIKGICSGLRYLHEEWQVGTPIIHMDLKPANILLDENMVPKIADFGLARLFGEEQTRTCTKSCEGTVGYMAPEYINRGIITKSLDIFSLGVIIIEIVTGHKEYPEVTETSSEEFTEIVLKNWRNRLKKELGSTSAVINNEEIRRCIQIGLACVKLDRSKRPTISQIVKILHESEGTECSNREVRDREGNLFTSSGTAASLDTWNTLHPAEPNNPLAIKGFTFSAVNCWRTSTKLFCCEFSSDGKMLASAGVEKKAVLWNLEAFETQYTAEEHRLVIADVSFRPKSTQLATSSFDRTIKLWNTADPKFSLHTFTGHPHQVVSLDFHPTKTDLLCSCDAFGEIRYWNVNRLKCERTMKGANCRVRFQPNAGRFLAAADANENVVSVFDIETHRTYALQGHGEWMQSLCWDNSGKYLATVSPHQVKAMPTSYLLEAISQSCFISIE